MHSVAPSRVHYCASCEELRAEVEYLREELARDNDAEEIVALRVAFGLTTQQAHLLQLLYVRAGRIVSKTSLDARMPHRGPERETLKMIDVQICRLRRVLGREAIATAWGEGYYLSPQGRVLIEAARRPVGG